MKRAVAKRLEMLADGFASASFGGASAVAVYHLLSPLAVQPTVIACAAAAGLAAYGIIRSLLVRVGTREPAVRVANTSRSNNGAAVASREFDSAVVVRLFGSAHAGSDAPADASESLHQALHQLRRSLANRR